MRKSGKQIETRQEESKDTFVASDCYDDDDANYIYTLDETQKKAVDNLLINIKQQMEERFEYLAEGYMASILMKLSSLVYSDYHTKRNEYNKKYPKP